MVYVANDYADVDVVITVVVAGDGVAKVCEDVDRCVRLCFDES